MQQRKRRKSSSTDVQRWPRKGDENYIKRPKNAIDPVPPQVLRGPPARGGRRRVPREKQTPGGPLENDQPTVEEPIHGGKAAFEAMVKRKAHERKYPKYGY